MSQLFEYLKIALMNIKNNKGRSFLTMLGIIIGISSVIMIISIGNGVKQGINEELNAMAGGQLYISSYGNNSEGIVVEFDDEDMDLIRETVPNVRAVTPKYNVWDGIATGRKGDCAAGISFGAPGLEYSSNDPVIRGRYFNENDYYSANRVCIITESSAKNLFGNTDVIGMSFELTLYGSTQEFTVVGIRQDSASMLNGLMVNDGVNIEAPLTVAGEAFGFYIDTYSDLLIISSDADKSAQVARDALSLMERKHGVTGKDVIQVENFSDYMSQMNSILGYVTVFVVFVAAISLLVGGIGVMNIMLVSVTERTREIGIRKALGARTGSILLQFLSESAIITLFGGVIGILCGFLGAYGICALIGFTARVDLATVLLASVFSSAVGIFFGIYPARKAAKLSPIEALRRE